MTEYLVKIGFWLRAYDSFTVEAATNAEAIEKAKAVAKTAMDSRAYPEAIDTDERRQGVIVYIDRLASSTRQAVAEDVAFDNDHTDASSR